MLEEGTIRSQLAGVWEVGSAPRRQRWSISWSRSDENVRVGGAVDGRLVKLAGSLGTDSVWRM
jgi:hypothetical protein